MMSSSSAPASLPPKAVTVSLTPCDVAVISVLSSAFCSNADENARWHIFAGICCVFKALASLVSFLLIGCSLLQALILLSTSLVHLHIASSSSAFCLLWVGGRLLLLHLFDI